MSPADAIIEELDSLEESTNTALHTLTDIVDDQAELVEAHGVALIDHASKFDELASRIEDLAQTVKIIKEALADHNAPGVDYRETLDEHERSLGDITRRLQALERAPAAQAPKQPGNRLSELEAQVRMLGPRWAEVEVWERTDKTIVLNNFLSSVTELNAHVAKSKAPAKAEAPF